MAAPVQRIVTTAAQTVAASFAAFSEVDLNTPTSGDSVVYQFRFIDQEPTSDERRTMYQNWLVSKGLQDLVRGVHESLEAAFVYTMLVTDAPDLTTVGKFNSALQCRDAPTRSARRSSVQGRLSRSTSPSELALAR